VTLTSVAPTFLVSDVGGTARWYAEHLGFALAGHSPRDEPYSYASVQRDAVELVLLRSTGSRKPDQSERRPEGLWDAYIRMTGVRDLYERVKGESFIHMTLKKQPYGDWEFEVRDPNGYVLVFGGDVDIE
jgi:uncharacterized glyoxalase superfamily protein PhnB